MLKKIGLVFRSTCILIFISFYGVYSDSRKIMGIRVISPKQAESIISDKTLSWTSEVLFIEGGIVPYDVYSGRYYISQSMDYEQWQGTVSCDSQYEIYIIQPEKSKSELVSSDTPLDLLVCEGDNYSLKGITVSGLPIVSLSCEYEENEESYGKITVIEPSAGGRENVFEVQSYNCSYHKRGGLSSGFPKSSFKLNILGKDGEGKKVSFLGMREDNDWILNPLYFDNTKMREKIGYDIWNNITELSDHKLEYCELLINGTYLGLYGLREPVDVKTFDQTKDNALMFSIKGWNEKLTGVMLMQDDARQILEQTGNINVELELESAPEGKINDALEIMRFLNIEGYESRYLDIKWDEKSFIDYEVFIEMIMAVDNTYKNQKICAVPDGDGYILYKSAWDLDITMQNEYWAPPIDTPTKDYFLPDDAETMNKCRNLYWQARQNFYNMDYIGEKIDGYTSLLQLSGAYKREQAAWDALPAEDSAAFLKNFFSERIKFLDEYYGGEQWNTETN